MYLRAFIILLDTHFIEFKKSNLFYSGQNWVIRYFQLFYIWLTFYLLKKSPLLYVSMRFLYHSSIYMKGMNHDKHDFIFCSSHRVHFSSFCPCPSSFSWHLKCMSLWPYYPFFLSLILLKALSCLQWTYLFSFLSHFLKSVPGCPFDLVLTYLDTSCCVKFPYYSPTNSFNDFF